MKGKEEAAEQEKSADKGKDAEDGDAKNLPDKVSARVQKGIFLPPNT